MFRDTLETLKAQAAQFDATQDLTAGDPTTFFTTHSVQGSTAPQRIWVVGDAGTGYASQRSVRDSYINFINGSRKADAWLMLGDNAYNHGREAEYQLGIFHNMYEPILRTTPLARTRNHDYGSTVMGTNTGPYYDLRAAQVRGRAYRFNTGLLFFDAAASTSSRWTATGYRAPPTVPWPPGSWPTAYARANATIIAYWHHPPYTKGSRFGQQCGRRADA
jgi:hypothetical protein